MADQVELTGNAVVQRLNMDMVPKAVNDEGSVEYYLWAITDQQLHHHLTDAYYGQFTDNIDDLYSVTLPPQRRKNLWVFAPSVNIIEWFADAMSDERNADKAKDSGELKFAYVKMSSVEERLDEGEYPVVKQLVHDDSRRLYAYGIKHLSVLNQLMIAQLDEGESEKDIFKALDERDASLTSQEEKYTNAPQTSSVKELKPVEVSDETDDDDGYSSYDDSDAYGKDDLSEDDGSFGAFGDVDSFPGFGDDIQSDYDTPATDEPTLSTDDETLTDTDELPVGDDDKTNSVGAIPQSDEIPESLKHMLSQIVAPVLKTPTVHTDDSLDGYREKVNDARDDLNSQLADIAKNAKRGIVSEYYKHHALIESKIDAELDPEHGDPRVTDAYKVVEDYLNQDLADLSVLEQTKRNDLANQMDDFHSAYIREALQQAENEWLRIKDTKYVEEPIATWKSQLVDQIDTQNNARMSQFNNWRKEIKSRKLAQVEGPIIESLSRKIKQISRDLIDEQNSARQELRQIEDRLFNQNLEMQKIEIQQSQRPSVQNEIAHPSTSSNDSSETDSYFDENEYDVTDGEPEDDSAIPVIDDTATDLTMIEPTTDDVNNDDTVEPDADDFDGYDDDDFEEDDTDDNIADSDDDESDGLDGFSFDDNDDDLDNDADNVDDIDGLDDLGLSDDDFSEDSKDDESPVSTETALTPIDRFVDESKDDVDEQAVIDNALADLDSEFDEEEDDDDVESETEPSKKNESRKKGKLSKSKKPAKPKKPKSSSGKLSKKTTAIIVGASVAVIVAILAVVLIVSGGGNNNLTVSPSPTNTYTKGTMLSGKRDGKNVALVIKTVNGNKLTVSDVSNNKTYVINKPTKK